MPGAERSNGIPTTSTVVVVMFNSSDSVGDCVASIPEDAEIVLVDQRSTDGSIETAREARSDVRVLHAGANRGFGAGCNLGAANASGSVLIFLNPDAVLAPGALEALTARAIQGDALVGPTLKDLDGTPITKARRWTSSLTDVLDLLLPRSFIPPRLQRDIPASDDVYDAGGPVPYIQGACMAIRSDVFWGAGGFDEMYFLYNEEESLSAQLAQRGVLTVLEPKAIVRHEGATSTTPVRAFAVRQYHRSRAIQYGRAHGTVGGTLRAAFLAAALGLLLVTSPLRRRLGYRKAENALFCRAALLGLADGLLRRTVVPPSATARTDAGPPTSP
jgi:N-acetylglucosaminyl-diphospho-decaprenol L-rhamnosyltransferase